MPAAAAVAICLAVTGPFGPTATGASVTTSATILSTTTIDVDGCLATTPGVADFGPVIPGDPAVTTGSNCVIEWGSSNNTSGLRIAQGDRGGSAMHRVADGSDDLTFDTDGVVTTPVQTGNDTGFAVVAADDGSIVVAGNSGGGTGLDFGAARYSATGVLDNTFSTDGKQAIDFAGGHDTARALAVQADGKVVLVGHIANGADNDFGVVRLKANGDLDDAFDTDGKVTTPIGAGNDDAMAVAVQPDGKIVAAGYANTGANLDIAVVRYTNVGALDTSFSGDGIVTTPVGAGTDAAYGMALQPDGKIVVAGHTSTGSNDFAVVRYTTTGALDTTFSGDGIATAAVGAGSDRGYAVALQPDGRIVVGGFSSNGVDEDMAAARFLANGTLDNTFSGDGMQRVPAGGAGTDHANAVAVQPDGRILLAGEFTSGTGDDTAVVRLNPDGSLDPWFAGDGSQVVARSATNDAAHAVAVLPGGKVLLVGYANMANLDWLLVRQSSGAPVPDWTGSWAAPGAFAVCLSGITGAGVTTTWTPGGACLTSSDAHWRALAQSVNDGVALAASAPLALDTATASFRFGIKAAAGQQPGPYLAPVAFSVVAP